MTHEEKEKHRKKNLYKDIFMKWAWSVEVKDFNQTVDEFLRLVEVAYERGRTFEIREAEKREKKLKRLKQSQQGGMQPQ